MGSKCMKVRELGALILTAVSAILFVRASIVPFFEVYGDPLDEMFMSAFSLVFVSAEFALRIKEGSFMVGTVMASIGAFYIYNGNRILGLITEEIARDTNSQGIVSANIYTMVIGVIILALGIFSIIRKAEERKRSPNVKRVLMDI